MECMGKGFFLSRTVVLGNDDSCSRRDSNEKTDDQVTDLVCRAADCGQSFFADKASYNDSICGIVCIKKFFKRDVLRNSSKKFAKTLENF